MALDQGSEPGACTWPAWSRHRAETIQLLLHDERDRYSAWPSFLTWVERASAGDIVVAYEVCCNPWVRYWMCYWVGRRELHAALPILVHALNDPDSGVLYEAAEALGRIGDPSTGYDLFKRYAVEDDPGVRSTLALALGDTGYRPVVPLLTDALADAYYPARLRGEGAGVAGRDGGAPRAAEGACPGSRRLRQGEDARGDR